jgi:hypothetical protein
LFRDAKAGLPAGGKKPERGHCLSTPAVGSSHQKKAGARSGRLKVPVYGMICFQFT